MDNQKLKDFIHEQDQLLRKVKTLGYSERERAYARMIKLGEEYGELCDAVLGAFGDQRRDKISKKDRENLEGEFADVVIVAYLLAECMDVDMDKALTAKMKMIRTKHNKILKSKR